jgi:hypothetical protein
MKARLTSFRKRVRSQSWRERALPVRKPRLFRPRLEGLESRVLLSNVLADYGNVPLSFEANQGQTDAQVRFLSHGSGYALFLTPTESVLSLQKQPAAGAAPAAPAVLTMALAGADPAAQVVGLNELSGKINYLRGNDPSLWHSDIPTYAQVESRQVYAGIDMVYHGNGQQLEYDFTVAPGANPGAIALDFQGQDSTKLDGQGNLVLHTAGGDIVEDAPVLYQDVGGARRAVSGGYVFRGANKVGFQVGAYDHSLPLVIDPVLAYSTYLGGFEGRGNAIAVDGKGNAFITGSVKSVHSFNDLAGTLDFPVKDPLQATFDHGGANSTDAFVTKLDPTGQLVFSTFLGGDPDESNVHPDPNDPGTLVGGQDVQNAGNAIAVDADGNVYLTGSAKLGELLGNKYIGFDPIVNPFQPPPDPNAFPRDHTFVAKLDATGGKLLYSSYLDVQHADALGFYGDSNGTGIAVDAKGNAYVVGTTFDTHDGLMGDTAFVAKINKDGTLAYQHALGDIRSDTRGNGIAVNAQGEVYIAGYTGDSTFATNAGANDTLGGFDAYVARLDPNGALVVADRLGGTHFDSAQAIALDPQGNVYVTGYTNSYDFSTSQDAFQATRPPGDPNHLFGTTDDYDAAFVAKYNDDLSLRVYSTYLAGGTPAPDTGFSSQSPNIGGEVGLAIAVDAAGSAYVGGRTTSNNLPSVSPVQPGYGGGWSDGFVAKLDRTGSNLDFLTYLGGGGNGKVGGFGLFGLTGALPGGFDSVGGIAVDTAGNAYVVGTTSSTSFPTTKGSFQETTPDPHGFFDTGDTSSVFIARLAPPLLVTALPVTPVLGQPYAKPVATFTAPDTSAPASDFSAEINWGDGTPPEIVTPMKRDDSSAPLQAAGPGETGAASPSGDGTTDLAAPFQVSGDHSYLKPGSYPVSVTVTDTRHNLSGTTTYNVSQAPGSQSETTVAVDPTNPKRVFAASNGPTLDNTLFASYSVDGGVTWIPSTTTAGVLTPAAGAGPLPVFGTDPTAAFDQFGNLYLCGVRKGLQFVDVLLSADGGKTFRLIGSFASRGGTVPPTADNPGGAAVDQPSIAVGPGDQPNTGSVWVTYFDFNVSTVMAAGARVIGLNQRTSAGAPPGTFDFKMADLSRGVIGNFGNIAVGPQGQVAAAWQTFGKIPLSVPRDAVLVSSNPDGLARPIPQFSPPVALSPVLGVRTSYVIPAQARRTITPDIRLAWDRSGRAFVAPGNVNNGRLYLAYTDALQTTTAHNATDIFVRHSDDGGASWSPPVRVNDDTGGHSHFFASIAVDQSTGDLGVSWYDTRNDPSNKKTQFFVAVSGDGGQTFSANVPVSPGPSDATAGLDPVSADFQYGDYTGTAFAGGLLFSAWADNSLALGHNPDLMPPALFGSAFDLAVGPVSVAHVTAAPPVVTAMPIRLSEGNTFQGQVATFTGSGLSPTDFKATIDWGDGQSDPNGSITQGAPDTPFIVRGSHRYAEEGAYPVVVTVTDTVNDLEGSSVTSTNVSQAAGNQSEANIAVDPTNPSDLFAVSNNAGDGLFAAVSTDGGATWQGHSLATGPDLPLANGDPKAVFDPFGNLFLTYLAADLKSIVVARSSDDGATFTRIYTFTSPGGTTPPGSIDPEGALVDQPSVAAGAGSVWVTFANSVDGDITAVGAPVMGRGSVGDFGAPQAVPNSMDANFGGIAIGPSGQVLVSFVQEQPGAAAAASVSLDSDGLGPGGFAPPVIVARPNYDGAPRSTGTSLPAQVTRGVELSAFLAWDAHQQGKDGRVYLVYMDAPAVGSTDTNIFVRSSTDSGATWGDPVRVNDDAGTNSQFFPTIGVDPKTGDVAVGWYDARNDPDNVKTQFFVAGSTDGGSKFSTNVQVSKGFSDASDPALNENQRGDYTGIAVFQGVIHPIWADNSSALGGIPDPPEFDLATAQVTLAGVDDLPLTANPLDINADVNDEGEAFTADLASFLDANPHGELADYTATIDWGDMTPPSAGTIKASGVRFVVSGTHAYEEEGPHTIKITIADKGGASVVVTNDADVEDGQLKAQGQDFKPVENQLFHGTVASFTDSDPNGQPDDYVIRIDWGGGVLTGGSVRFSGTAALAWDPYTGSFFTIGNNDKETNDGDNDTDDVPGALPSASDRDGPPELMEISTTGVVTNVAALDPSLHPGGLALDLADRLLYAVTSTDAGLSTLDRFDPSAGTFLPVLRLGTGFTGGLAYDANNGDFYAIADDGSNSALYQIDLGAGAVTPVANLGPESAAFFAGLTFEPADGKLYAAGSDGHGSSTLYRITPGGAFAVTPLFVLGTGFTGGLAFVSPSFRVSGPPVPAALLGQFAGIAGDGSGSAALDAISLSGPVAALFEVGSNFNDGFNIIGTHPFGEEATTPVEVSIRDVGGSMVTAHSSATVVDPVPDALTPPPAPTAFQGFPTGPLTLASFTVPGGAETGAGEYAATIDWGDGSSGAGLLAVAGAAITVSSSGHTYAAGGTFHPRVTLADDTTGSVTVTEEIHVAPDVSSQVRVVGLGGPFNPLTQGLTSSGSIANVSGVGITGPLRLVLRGLPAGVELLNRDGFMATGEPYLDLPNVPRLDAGQTKQVVLVFGDAALLPFTYSVITLDGPPGGFQAGFDANPPGFMANEGQADPSVRFLAQGNSYSLMLTSDEAVLALQKPEVTGSVPAASDAVLRLQLVGANSVPNPVGLDPLPGRSNYLIGDDPSRWHTNVATYGRVEYRDVYAGITLAYHSSAARQLEYDFTVAPEADPGVIRLAFQGADGMTLDAQGNLVLHTVGGDVVEQAPLIYQESNGVRQTVAGGYELRDNGQIAFRVGPYDHTQPIIIDPVLVYSTYLGGSGRDEGNAIAVDGAGNVYVAGRTFSPDFPVLNAFEAAPDRLGTGFGGSAAFVTKYDATGALVYSTYLGGSKPPNWFGAVGDSALGIAVDGSGQAYLAGRTTTVDFPSVNAIEPFRGGFGFSANFLAKLNPTGSGLVYSTSLGDFNLTGFTADGAGNVYVTGNSFVEKLDPTGKVVYSTVLDGGNSNLITGLAVDAAGAAYVTGTTLSDAFPTTPGAFEPRFRSTTTFTIAKGGATWSNTGLSVPVSFLAADPSQPLTLYAASSPILQSDSTTTRGLFKSTDGGNNWAPLSPINASVLAIDPVTSTTLYAGSNQFLRVYKSTEGGAHWVPSDISERDFFFDNVTALAIDPSTPATLYAGTTRNGVFKSTDAGAHWTAVNNGLFDARSGTIPALTSLIIDSHTTTTLYAGTVDRVFKSSDSGATWALSAAGMPDTAGTTALVQDPSAPATLYAGTAFDGIFKTTNGGASWTANNRGISGVIQPDGITTVFGIVTSVVIDPSQPGTIYVALDGREANAPAGVFKSTDGGGTWAALNTGLPGPNIREIATLAIDPKGTLFAGRTELESDVFVAKVKPDGSGLAYATYLGGTRDDTGGGIAVDAAGNAYVTGATNSADFPTANAPQAVNHGGPAADVNARPGTDAFVAKLSADGSTLVYGTYLGGTANDVGSAIAVDAAGNAYVIGQTESTDFPIQHALQPTPGGAGDAFVARLNVAGMALDYSTYLGGSDTDRGNAIAVDAAGNAYVTGYTSSPDLRTVNPAQPFFTGGGFLARNAFVAKIAPQGPGILQVTNLPFQPTEGVSFTGAVAAFTDTDTDTADSYTATIDWGDGTTSSGVVSSNGARGGFVVTGTHAYADEGQNAVTVTIREADGRTASAVNTAAFAASPAGFITYHVTLDTSAQQGTSGFLDFQFNPGALPEAQPANLIVSNFTSTGGTLAGAATSTGGVAGDLTTSLQLHNSGVLNEQKQGFTFGSEIHFDVRLDGEALAHAGQGLFGSTFSLALLEPDGRTALAMADPSGAVARITLSPDGTTNFVADNAGSTPIARAVVANLVTVADAPLQAALVHIQAVEGAPFSGTVATFTDTNPSSTPADFTAVILWGDGSAASPGTVVAEGGGKFHVTGSHTYLEAGSLQIQVLVKDQGGSAASAVPTEPSVITGLQASRVANSAAPASLFSSATAGDFNGDGKPDLAFTIFDEQTSHYALKIVLFNGDGTFQDAVTVPTLAGTDSMVIAGDANGDGKLDLITNSAVYLGNGDGTFQPGKALNLGNPRMMVSGDFNGDGKLDLAVVDVGVAVLLGNGDGTFTRAPDPVLGTAGNIGVVPSIVAGDFTRDGKLDLAFTASNFVTGQRDTFLLTGNGDGTFQGAALLADDFEVGAAADLNGDGKLDLAGTGGGVAENRGITGDKARVLLGNGDGTFQAPMSYFAGTNPQSGFVSPGFIQVGDFNGDGKLDLAVADSGVFTSDAITGTGVSILPGKGDGTFTAAATFPTENVTTLVAGDFNGDGKRDLAVAGTRTLSLLLGNGDGTLVDDTLSPGGTPIGGQGNLLAQADFNQDGKVDVVTAASFGESPFVNALPGKGDGTFQTAIATPAKPGPVVLSGDINGDGKPDIVTAGSILLGNGDGSYQPPLSLGIGGAAVAMGDFNGDGKFDLVIDTAAGIVILLGNGDGTFQGGILATGQQSSSVAVGDFNGDGKQDLDLTAGTQVTVLLGKGDGTFQTPVVTAVPDSGPVAISDFNGDGKLDLVVTALFTSDGVSVLLGNGDGTFQPAVTYDTGQFVVGATVGDFNGDGKLDLAVSILTNVSTVDVLLGNGDGTFQKTASYAGGGDSIVAGDFNGDGKADLAIRIRNGGLALLVGNGDGSFQPAVYYATAGTDLSGSLAAIAAADVNGDGRLDLIYANLTGTLDVFLARGDGTLLAGRSYAATTPSSLPVGTKDFEPVFVTAGDLNHDGKPDVFGVERLIDSAGDNKYSAFVQLNRGDGTFQPAVDYPVGDFGFNDAVSGDFNGDGIPDLAVDTFILNQGHFLAVLSGNVDGTFQKARYLALPDRGDGLGARLLSGDFNRDGKPDLVRLSTTDNNTTVMRTYLGNGDGTFQSPIISAPLTDVDLTGSGSHPFAAADFNGDGKLDLVLAPDHSVGTSPDERVMVLRGNGDGSFQAPVVYMAGGEPSALGTGDLNGDGKIDLVTSNRDGTVSLSLGNGDGSFQKPLVYLLFAGRPGDPGFFPESAPLVVADFNGDGVPDVGVLAQDRLLVLLNRLGPGTAQNVADAPLTAAGANHRATQGIPFLGTVAHFTDANPLGLVSDYTATITWADGHTSPGTITPDGHGGFTVLGTNVFSQTGPSAVNVAIADKDGAQTTASGTITVDSGPDAPLTAAGSAIAATARVAFAGTVATFTDADASVVAEDFTATITWGDGQTSAGFVRAGASEGFEVQGSNTYAQPGNYAVTVAIVHAAGATATANGSAVVAPNTAAPLTATGTTVHATERIVFSGLVATFTDGDASGRLGDYTATIDWGDGQTSGGTVTADPQTAGQFNVTGANVYRATGTYPVAVSLVSRKGATAAATGTADVAAAPLTVHGLGANPTEGAPFTGAVATFVDAVLFTAPGDYTATIDWGDGQTSPGSVVADPQVAGTFDVAGSNTYARFGLYPITLTITARGHASTAQVLADVADAPLTASGMAIQVTAGTAYTGAVASFTDQDPAGKAGDYAATIFWGDGHTSFGTITANAAGGFDVAGSNTYADGGTYAVLVWISEKGGASATAVGTATVVEPTGTLTAGTLQATEGVEFSGLVATFTPPKDHLIGDFTAAIDWGDGHTTAGTFVADPRHLGQIAILGTSTYAEEGGFTVTITVATRGGVVARVQTPALVADAPLAARGVPVNATKGQPFTGVVTTFTDADPAGQVSDYSAGIDWGNGQASAGQVMADPLVPGQFDVVGTIVYPNVGAFGITVTIGDVGGATAVAHGPATVVLMPTAAGADFTARAGEPFSAVVATITAGSSDDQPADFTALIDWGDGHTSAGFVTADPAGAGKFLVLGSSTYPHVGAYSVKVAIRAGDGFKADVSSTATVSPGPDAFLVAVPGIALGARTGEALTAIVAGFRDSDPAATVGAFTATITWGDGSDSTGRLKADPTVPGQFIVLGRHTYLDEGLFPVGVLVQDNGGASTTTTAVALIKATALPPPPEIVPVPGPPQLPPVEPPPTAPALNAVTPAAVVEGTSPLLTLAGARLNRASVVLLFVVVGGRRVLLRLPATFVPGVGLRARIPRFVTVPGQGRFVTLAEDRPASLLVFTPGAGFSAARPLRVLEAGGTPRERAVVEFAERRLHREVTLADLAPAGLRAAFVDLVFRRFHLTADGLV